MPKLRERLATAVRSDRAPELAGLLALLLGLPSLLLGELLDDHLLRANAAAPDGPPAWDYFRFVEPGEITTLRERGWVGWWAADDLEARLLRPLSSLTHAFDQAVWPGAVWLMHLENVLLYALLAWVVARLIQRVHGPGLAAGVAAVVFAIDESHALTVMWISGRNTMLAALFGLLAVHAHLRWRDPDTPRAWRFGLAATLWFALALASGEAGLCSFGYVLAWTLVGEHGRGSNRALALLPYLAVIALWRIIYVHYGFGVTGSSLYLDLDAHPLTFVGRALSYPPSLGMAQLSLPVTDLLVMEPRSWIALALLFAALCWALLPILKDSRAQFWLLGMLFAAIPLAGTIPTARLLLLVGAGGSALIGLAFVARREQRFVGGARRALVGLCLIGNLILAPLIFVPYGLANSMLERPHTELAAQLPADEVCVILNLPAEINGLYSRAVRERDGGRWPEHVYTLYAGRDPLEVERIDATTLELHSEAGWAAEQIDRFARDWTDGFAVGDRVALELATVEVVEVSEDARPTRVRVRFERDLDELALFAFDPTLTRTSLAIGERVSFTGAI